MTKLQRKQEDSSPAEGRLVFHLQYQRLKGIKKNLVFSCRSLNTRTHTYTRKHARTYVQRTGPVQVQMLCV